MFNQPTIFEETSEVVVQYNCSTAYVPATDVKIKLNITVGSVEKSILIACKNETIKLSVDINSVCKWSNELHINITKTFGGGCYNSVSFTHVRCQGNWHVDKIRCYVYIIFVLITERHPDHTLTIALPIVLIIIIVIILICACVGCYHYRYHINFRHHAGKIYITHVPIDPPTVCIIVHAW